MYKRQVEGIGEHITPVALPPLRLAVLKPAASLPTVAIFTAPDLVRDTDRAILLGFPEQDSRLSRSGVQETLHARAVVGATGEPRGALQRVSIEDIASGFGRNDLEAVAKRMEPEVQQALLLMEQAFGNSRMTGSGSAVFSRVPGSSSQAMPQALPEHWTGRMCCSLEAHPLRGWVED